MIKRTNMILQPKKVLKKLLFFALGLVVLASCNNSGNGQLIGVQDRPDWYQPDPYGMVFVPMGSYEMGISDEDVPYSHVSQTKTVSVQAFYMDETEITNNEYRQFVHWVRDSIVHRVLGLMDDPDTYGEHFQRDDEGMFVDRCMESGGECYAIDWSQDIEWDNPEVQLLLEQEGYMLPEEEQFYYRSKFDWRKLNYDYFWIDYQAAASRGNREQGLEDRSAFIVNPDPINVYPDTLVWVRDFAYSYNEPMTQKYFWHPSYDHYPVVGVNWKQAKAFSIWRTQLHNGYLKSEDVSYINDYRLPTESEWEWGARGGLDLNKYPWGGPYIRNSDGCFLANYKPLRGNLVDDGGFHTVIVAHYAPNDWGLYDMAGNVAEWTSDAYDESAYNYGSDFNQQVSYNAKDGDSPAQKRKVIRGGSWKDIGYYIRNGVRTYEYQDTAKSYIGFRNVQTYLGRAKGDGPDASNIYN
ncbi:MAG: SUMF1/EgtB/PvdO family nonheme iron enzyme [Bacteroidales bacterium]